MKKLLLTALLCFSINGFAFNWKKVTESKKGHSFYVDVDSIKKHNGLVYYWLLADYLEPTSDGDNSSISKWRVDCGEEKETLLNTTWYSQLMGKGKILQEDTVSWDRYPKPKSFRYKIMKFACANAK